MNHPVKSHEEFQTNEPGNDLAHDSGGFYHEVPCFKVSTRLTRLQGFGIDETSKVFFYEEVCKLIDSKRLMESQERHKGQVSSALRAVNLE